eukprot:TRINITY_DN6143_c0_g2_i2.p2 TRINITY_DN6143_c0_g2~~TRINITY_DN6143_c0_g2_i2.p2  ORF type:complete len:127 (-),score=20.88 TRINITY_DN6143_c0_g2_i2:363-743(-)
MTAAGDNDGRGHRSRTIAFDALIVASRACRRSVTVVDAAWSNTGLTTTGRCGRERRGGHSFLTVFLGAVVPFFYCVSVFPPPLVCRHIRFRRLRALSAAAAAVGAAICRCAGGCHPHAPPPAGALR